MREMADNSFLSLSNARWKKEKEDKSFLSLSYEWCLKEKSKASFCSSGLSQKRQKHKKNLSAISFYPTF